MKHPGRILRRLIRNRSGNVAIITALSALPMLGLFGLCIDYGISLSNKSKLDAAADAAAVAAITTVQSALLAKSPDALGAGKTRGLAVFAANAGKINFLTSTTPPVPSIDLTLSPDGTSVQAKVAYATTTTSQFGGLFGVPKANISGTTTSTLGLTQYVKIYLAVDISQSMGIAASSADMDKMLKVTPANGRCVFACHLSESPPELSYEEIAHQNSVSLRIDVVKKAVVGMIDQAQKSITDPAKTKIGLYTFEKSLTPLASPDNQFAALHTTAEKIDLGSDFKLDNRADSYANVALSAGGVTTSGNAFASLTDTVGTSGDGYSESSPKKFVFLMTDGTSDTYDGIAGQIIAPYDPAWVADMKANKVTVGVVYTTYLEIYNNNDPTQGFDYWYWINVSKINQPGNSKIRSGLQATASSPTWFVEASDGTAIANALNKLFAQAQSPARLTN